VWREKANMLNAEVKPPFVVVLVFLLLEHLEGMYDVNIDGIVGGVNRRIYG
jgi:hypothetical protein